MPQEDAENNENYQDSIQDSFYANAFSLIFSMIRGIVTFVILMTNSDTCNQPLRTFLWLSVGYDFYNLGISSYIVRLQRSQELNEQELNMDDKKCITVMKDLKQMFFLVTFIFGNFWVFDSSSNCKQGKKK